MRMSQSPPFPLLSNSCWGLELVVKGAPWFGAAERTLDDRLRFPRIDGAGKGGPTREPRIWVFYAATSFTPCSTVARVVRIWNGFPDLSTANR